MKAHFYTKGDESVGIFPVQGTIESNEEYDQEELVDFLSDLHGEVVQVNFDEEYNDMIRDTKNQSWKQGFAQVLKDLRQMLNPYINNGHVIMQDNIISVNIGNAVLHITESSFELENLNGQT